MKLGTYRHFKGDKCEVISIAKHSETLEELVIYKHNDSLWARPKKMFEEDVNGKPRFKYIGE